VSLLAVLCGACGGGSGASAPSGVEWATYGQNQLRTSFNSSETKITTANVGSLQFKWRYLTDAIVSASPTVAYINVPGEGNEKIVFIESWDGNFYALRASNGSRLWNARLKPQPGASYPYASSATVATVAGEQRVYVGGGMTMYSFVAATGEERWEFDAGTGCTSCDPMTERNEIESSPAVVGSLVYFGMDVNSGVPAKGGAFAVDAADGHLVWYFDIDSASTCRPRASDDVRRFDGYHSASQLRLADDFFSTREGCNFARYANPCAGEMWSSFAVDEARQTIYAGTSNCDSTTTMPPYDESVFALTFDGVPKWVWRPRQTDTADLDFGATPNLFTVAINGVRRDVVGAASKDGTYYLLDRDGVNKNTGQIEPYWRMQVVPGGDIGGIIGSAAVANGQVFFHTAIGLSISMIQMPTSWALDATDGTVAWSSPGLSASYGPTTAIPGIVFGGDIGGSFAAQDATTGSTLGRWQMGGPESSGGAVVDGEIFVGDGTGSRDGSPSDPGYKESLLQSYVSALCLPDAPDCPTQLCDDGNPCTYDFHGDVGCESEPYPDGLRCTVSSQPGTCQSGACSAAPGSPTAAAQPADTAQPQPSSHERRPAASTFSIFGSEGGSPRSAACRGPRRRGDGCARRLPVTASSEARAHD
jgi:polyvinyl alcohol dehydrogenase (cytochrome)